MNCGETRELIQLYLDNELDARSTLAVQHHLDSCAACSRQLDSLLLQDQKLRQAARAEGIDSARVRAGILTAIGQGTQDATPGRAEKWTRSRWRKIASWQRVVTPAAIVLAVTMFALRGGWMPGADRAVYAAIAADHSAHCSADITMGAVTDPNELRGLVTTFAAVNDLPEFSAFGYGNPRGRICTVNNASFLHLVYYHSSQPPISLFLRKHDSNLIPTDLTALHTGSFTVISVSRSRVDLLVVSSLAEEQMSIMVRGLASRL